MVKILKIKQFWNQCDKWNNLVACLLVICDKGDYKNPPTTPSSLEMPWKNKLSLRSTLHKEVQNLWAKFSHHNFINEGICYTQNYESIITNDNFMLVCSMKMTI